MSRSALQLALGSAAGSIAVALLWIALAAATPTTNYHLSPLVAVVAAPTVARALSGARLATVPALTAVGIGVAVSSATAVTIHNAGWSQGPTIADAVSPLVELIGAIAIGAVGGAIVAVIRLRTSHQVAAKSDETRRRRSSTDH